MFPTIKLLVDVPNNKIVSRCPPTIKLKIKNQLYHINM